MDSLNFFLESVFSGNFLESTFFSHDSGRCSFLAHPSYQPHGFIA